MDITIQRRAKIALRSLEQNEQKQILNSLQKLEVTDAKALWKIPNLEKLSNNGQNLYVYRGSSKLRLILSIQDNHCNVEDIFYRDKLDQLVANLK